MTIASLRLIFTSLDLVTGFGIASRFPSSSFYGASIASMIRYPHFPRRCWVSAMIPPFPCFSFRGFLLFSLLKSKPLLVLSHVFLPKGLLHDRWIDSKVQWRSGFLLSEMVFFSSLRLWWIFNFADGIRDALFRNLLFLLMLIRGINDGSGGKKREFLKLWSYLVSLGFGSWDGGLSWYSKVIFLKRFCIKTGDRKSHLLSLNCCMLLKWNDVDIKWTNRGVGC